MTRLAGGSPAMWSSIVNDNAPAIVDALAACEARLRAVREALLRDDGAAARRFLEAGSDWFDGEPERVLTHGGA
jgi:prephenate dehydrogenase